MNDYTFADLYVGLTETFECEITEEMLAMFRELSGDVNPLHCDDDFARKRGYASKVCYGMLTASLISRVGGVFLPGKNCLIQSVEAKFARPVYVGDVLTVSGTVGELHESVEQAIIKVTMANQRGEMVLRGTV